MKNQKVSIIIPCYNCETTLNRCLDSVFAQTYKNIEVICVNDGSKDKTKNILESYSKRKLNLKVFTIENQGVSNARNLGLKQSSGDLVMYLDSDDNYLSKNIVKKCVKKLNKKKVDMVVFNFKHPCFQTYLKKRFFNLNKKSDFFKYYQDFFVSMMPWNKLFKKELIKSPYRKGIAFAEDELFNLENLINFKKIYYFKKPYHNYFCDTKMSKDSAINKTIADKNFWETKNTIWYKGDQNFNIRKEIIENHFDKKYQEELLYFRSFDFFFYDLQFMLNAKINTSGIKKEMFRIFHEEHFIHSLKLKEKNGLYLRKFNDEDLVDLIDEFVEECSFYYSKNKKFKCKSMLILLNTFAKIFCKCKNSRWLNRTDILAKCLYNYQKDKSKEMKFINKNLFIYKKENTNDQQRAYSNI